MFHTSTKGGAGMKKKLAIVGITMNAAGSEKSFLGFAGNIDYSEWDVTLYLARAAGDFMHLVPKEITVKEIVGGEIFLADKTNAKKIIFNNYIKKNPLRAFTVAKHCLKIAFAKGRERVYAKNRLWLSAMEALPPIDEEYDVAIAYWGDRTMFYTADKLRAKKKITWLHFDFNEPPREKSLYENYFLKFDKIITVSESIEESLTREIPSIKEKTTTVENFTDAEKIKRLSEEPCEIDGDDGTKLLTVGRICEQKGYDMALPAVKKLIDEGYALRWYIIGKGEGEYYEKFKKSAEDDPSVKGRVRFIGTTDNPYKYMRACDIYFQPSRHEGKPIAVEEAKILCKPTVAAAFRSVAEQLSDGKYGEICEASEEGLYAGLKRLLTNEERIENIKKCLSDIKRNAESKAAVDDILTN